MALNPEELTPTLREDLPDHLPAFTKSSSPTAARLPSAPSAPPTKVEAGQQVAAGDPVAIIEAMKMEATISAPLAGTIDRVVLNGPTKVEGNDLIVVITPA